MKITHVAIMLVSAFLVSCGGSAKDLKLSEMNQPQNQTIILEQLTTDERNLLSQYIAAHSISGGLDYSTKIGDAIESQKKMKSNINKIQ